MIKEDYVSFEIAKLLKEKGFCSEDCFAFYNENGDIGVLQTFGDMSDYLGNTNTVDAPTIQMAMKWLRETYNIHIVPYFDKLQNSDDLPYSFTLYLVSEHCATIEKTACFDIDENYYWKYPEQACEAAIKYCLEKLI